MRIAAALAMLLALQSAVGPAQAGGGSTGSASPRELAASVERASRTEGFRLRATITAADAQPPRMWRVLVAGEKDSHRQRLLVQALAPEAFRGQSVAVEAGAATRAVRYGPGTDSPARPVDPYAALFGSGLVIWDLLGEWWRWPHHERVGEESLLGHNCVVMDSSGGSGPIARVRSWIAPKLRAPLRLEFYDAGGTLLRAIRVNRIFRRADGSGAARAMTIRGADDVAVRFEVYNGTEGVRLPPKTFSALAREPAAGLGEGD